MCKYGDLEPPCQRKILRGESMFAKSSRRFLLLRLRGNTTRMVDRDTGLPRYLFLHSKLALRFILHRIILSTTTVIERIRFYKNSQSSKVDKERIDKAEGMKVMQKVMLKTVFIFVNDNKEFQLPLKHLAKVNSFSFNGKKLARKECPRCKMAFDNTLLFILHLQLIHTDNLCVTLYEFQKDQLIICAKDTSNTNQSFLKKMETGEIMLTKSLKERTRAILGQIFNKFSAKKGKNERQYYSTYDVFKPLQEFKEQESMGALQRELQKMRICDFSDVSESDKRFFLIWNDFMSKCRKTQGTNYVDADTMGEILKKFCTICKGQQIQRNSLLMHLWTMWSAGKIGSIMITICLDIYDKSA